MDIFAFDQNQYVKLLCGVDEAGRGPLAGDVYAAAVILPEGCVIEGLNDSKKLSEKKRELLYDQIIERATAYCIATASVAEIEEINILNATFLAMNRAVAGLSIEPELVLVDGNRDPHLPYHTRTIVKGDATSACIAAASILAKVARDRYMKAMDEAYPQYQFCKHKGYGTKLHYQMLDEFGESDVHRHSFLKKYYAARQELPVPVIREETVGQMGERLTAKYLCDHGCEILHQNYHSRYGEIDLVAATAERLLFVEVKTRKQGTKFDGKTAVTSAKQRKMIQTARQYLQEYPKDLAMRFDVAEVYLSADGKAYIHYIKAAFDLPSET